MATPLIAHARPVAVVRWQPCRPGVRGTRCARSPVAGVLGQRRRAPCARPLALGDFYPNDLGRYSLGTKNKSLIYNNDRSLTLFVSHTFPSADLESNWLPSADATFSLYLRATFDDARSPSDARLGSSPAVQRPAERATGSAPRAEGVQRKIAHTPPPLCPSP